MSMTTAMDGIGDVNHIDTVHDDINPEYKEAMEKAMEKQEELTQVKLNEPVETVEASTQMEKPTNIWLQFNTLSVGWDEEGKPTATFDLVTLLRGLERLGSLEIRPMPQPEENATDDIEEVKQEAKWQHNGQPDNPTTNE